jgi:hypothetical protein
MKKEIRILTEKMAKLRENQKGVLEGGFASLKGGFASAFENGSNFTGCTNSGDCRTSTNSSSCVNVGTCLM